MRRVAVAAACGLALAVLVCATVAQQRQAAGASVLDEKAAGLSQGEKSHVKAEISRLEAKVKKEQDKAARLDKAVEADEMKLRKKVVEAKKKREEGDKLEESARRKVHDVDRMRDEAQHLRNEADAARKKFLSAEKPVEMASQLAAHDHAKYRASELKVAKEVVKLSEHPGDAKIHREVSKMVRASKEAKKKMEGDAAMLKKLEARAGSSRFSGAEGYDRLRQKSVDVAQDAKSIAKRAEKLAEKGHNLRDNAARAVKAVEDDMRRPDREHKRADALRKEYEAGDAKLSKLRAELDEGSKGPGGGGGGGAGAHAAGAGESLAAGGSKYSKERAELGKIIARGAARGGGGGGGGAAPRTASSRARGASTTSLKTPTSARSARRRDSRARRSMPRTARGRWPTAAVRRRGGRGRARQT